MATVNIKAAFGVFAATLLALAIVWLSAASAYWSGRLVSDWPWAGPGLIAGVLIGLVAIANYPFKSRFSRVIGIAIFLVCLLTAVLYTALLTACSYGDCL